VHVTHGDVQLADQARTDPERSTRTLMSPMPAEPNGQPTTIPNCGKAPRESSGYRR
jgi:hypothetical protein